MALSAIITTLLATMGYAANPNAVVHADSISNMFTISGAYVDTVHGTPPAGAFPSPWSGSSNTNFYGDAAPYDTPAVRIDNSSNMQQSIFLDMVYKVGSNNYFLTQGKPMTVPANGTAIQVMKFTNDQYSQPTGYDLSEHNSCTQNSVTALVVIWFNSQQYQYQDDRQVLTGGGIDPDFCSGANETAQWSSLTGPLLDAPGNVRISSTGQNQASVTWTAPHWIHYLVLGYRVVALKNGSFTNGQIVQLGGGNAVAVDANTLTATISGLDGGGVSYTFIVQALNGRPDDVNGAITYGYGPYAATSSSAIPGRSRTYAGQLLSATATVNNCVPLGGKNFSIQMPGPTPAPIIEPITFSDSSPAVYYRMSEHAGGMAADSSTCGYDANYNPSAVLDQPGGLGPTPGGTDTTTTVLAPPNAATLTFPAGKYILYPLPSGSAARSMEAWFNTQNAAHQDVAAYGSNAPGAAFGLATEGTTLQLYTWSHDLICQAPYAVSDGRWHHIAGTFDGGSTGTIYLDGSLVCHRPLSNPATIVSTSPTDLTVGSFGETSNSAFQGTMGDFALYGYALSPTEASAHWATYQPWTQDDNDAWPENHETNPQCGGGILTPCVSWGGPPTAHLQWGYASPVDATFYPLFQTAFAEWSAMSQPYGSPLMTDCLCESASPSPNVVDLLDIQAVNKNLQPGMCGYETDNGGFIPGTSGLITSAVVQLTNGSSSGCDLKADAVHEVGHALGVGHSSDSSDVMYSAPGTTAIDLDAQCALIHAYRKGGPCYSDATPAP